MDRAKNRTEKHLPELLAPAGSAEALEAAIEGGADAVYLGLSAYGARAFAKNFTLDGFSEAAKLAHGYGVKLYVTLNTLVTDRETEEWLRLAYGAAERGADAIICADLGCASLSAKYIPTLPLHGSTQITGHSPEAANFLADMGFTRMVCAREMSKEDIVSLVKGSKIEIEQFVHGAQCMSVSGQCLMSSVIGGRSGNRGECAQPCRLPYKNSYPLSLRDMSLASHIPEIIESGVASLKIEGRMKPPAYVYGVTKIYRRLLDCGRAADKSEEKELAALFSRGGFTDGYYVGKVGHSMLGVRSDADKERSAEAEKFPGLSRKIPVSVRAVMKLGEPSRLTLSASDGRTFTAVGQAPEEARTSPVDRASAERSLCRFGGTAFAPSDFDCELDTGVMLPVSAMNSLRRAAVSGLSSLSSPEPPSPLPDVIPPVKHGIRRVRRNVGIFRDRSQITPSAKRFFDRIFLPLGAEIAGLDFPFGVVMPPVVFPSDADGADRALRRAVSLGAKYVMIENPGQYEAARKSGLEIFGGHRLNITNSAAAELWNSLGVESVVLSPELRAPAARDVGGGVAVYGRIPLMITEKCLISELSACSGVCPGAATLTDRTGTDFPVLPVINPDGAPVRGASCRHRSEIFNSLPTSMSDKQSELEKYSLSDRVFLFTVENSAEVDLVIDCFEKGRALPQKVRRLP